jgi:hypothetical protein
MVSRFQVLQVIPIGLLLLLLSALPVQADPPVDDKHVRIINSYHRGFAWSEMEESEFVGRLQAAYPSVDIPIEFREKTSNACS